MAFCARRVIARAPKEVVIVGVTGSTGKTSTKEALGLVAKHIWHGEAVVSPGNLNNEIGLPLTILDYQNLPTIWQYPILLVSAILRSFFLKPAKCYVLEYAIDSPGDMKYLTGIAKPNWSVLTNITSVHLENFNNQKDLIDEKLILMESMPAGSNLVVNGEDEILSKRIKKNNKYSVYSFGKNNQYDVVVSSTKISTSATTFNFHMEGIRKEFKICALGAHYVASVVPAIVFGIKNNLSVDTVQRVIGEFRVLPGRGNIIAGINNSSIINDTYNANPLSVEAALNLIKQIPATSKIAVLGDMLELGQESKRAHYEVLKHASHVADKVITVGLRMHEAGGGNINFSSPYDAARYLKEDIDRGSLILIKGSQSMRMELVVKAIMANPEIAVNVLPRQSKAWLKRPFIEV